MHSIRKMKRNCSLNEESSPVHTIEVQYSNMQFILLTFVCIGYLTVQTLDYSISFSLTHFQYFAVNESFINNFFFVVVVPL